MLFTRAVLIEATCVQQYPLPLLLGSWDNALPSLPESLVLHSGLGKKAAALTG